MLNITHLLEHPKLVTRVANWIHREFWAESNIHTPESLERLLRQASSPDAIPLSLIAFEGGEPVGTVNLVENDDDCRVHLRPWLAALFVVPKQRGYGIGSALVRTLQDHAAALGISTLYLGTDNPGFYKRLGATVHEQVTDKFLIMQLRCPASCAIAERFSKALDADDFDSAKSVLSDNCQYLFHDKLIQGPDAIIQSYREASKKAARLFDRIEYGSELVEFNAQCVVIRFSDRLQVQGQTHVYNSQQRLTFNRDGRIVRIDHQEFAGQREALDAFIN